MSGTQGPAVPPEPRDGDPAAPYPGWSTEQPSAQPSVNGWTAPGTSGWDAPSAEPPGSGAAGAGAPGGPGQRGWQSTTEATWGIPDVKPGVIPLRPLGVGEILDGAVTTIRRNPAAMLGLSAIVAVVTQVAALFAIWGLFDDLSTAQDLGPATNTSQMLDVLSSSLASLSITQFITWLGTVFLTGVLTVVVGRAVLGEKLTAAQAWRQARGRMLRLLGLTLLYTLMWVGTFVLLLVVTALTTLIGGGASVALAFLTFGLAIAATAWVYVRFSLAGPSLMLESTTTADGTTKPVGIGRALGRSSELVRGSWWRVFGILALVFIIVLIIGNVIAVPFGIPTLLSGDAGNTEVTFGALALSSLGGIISATITAPFSAAATALLYIDRRIRREGLDIELARAAGVELPAHTDRPGGQHPGAQ